MESEWPEKRMQAVLPFMAHMPCSYGEVAFKNGNRLTISARRPQGPPAETTGSPIDPHLAACCRPLLPAAFGEPHQGALAASQVPSATTPEFAGCHDAPQYPLPNPRTGGSHRPWTS